MPVIHESKIINKPKTGYVDKEHKVFIVDDHPLIREALSQYISHENDLSVCGGAGDISNAMKAIAECRPDIVIVDLSLGQSSGIRLIEELSSSHPTMLFLVLSMHDESIYAERCLKAGARGYIMKEEPTEKIIQAMRRVLSGNIYISEKLQATLFNKLITNQSGSDDAPIACLSNRELEVFQLIGHGLRTRQAAKKLNLSVKTIETYVEHIKRKMKFNSLHELTATAIRWVLTENI